jgi:hypothetical protein
MGKKPGILLKRERQKCQNAALTRVVVNDKTCILMQSLCTIGDKTSFAFMGDAQTSDYSFNCHLHLYSKSFWFKYQANKNTLINKAI